MKVTLRILNAPHRWTRAVPGWTSSWFAVFQCIGIFPHHWSPPSSLDVPEVRLWTHRSHVSTRTPRARWASVSFVSSLPGFSRVSWGNHTHPHQRLVEKFSLNSKKQTMLAIEFTFTTFCSRTQCCRSYSLKAMLFLKYFVLQVIYYMEVMN